MEDAILVTSSYAREEGELNFRCEENFNSTRSTSDKRRKR